MRSLFILLLFLLRAGASEAFAFVSDAEACAMSLFKMVLVPCDRDRDAKRQRIFDQCKNRYDDRVTVACMDEHDYIVHPAHRHWCAAPGFWTAECFMGVE
jgi:hypothetical protein